MWRDMMRTCVGVALCLGLAGVSAAQTTSTTTHTRKFEVIGVDGNKLVVKDEHGTEEITVPDDFRFDIDGKQMSVHDLKVGMKGTATITATTTVTPVFATEVRNAEVMQASGPSIIVRTDQGLRMFGPADVTRRGATLYRNGQPARLNDFRRGDRLTATIVTEERPKVVTERQVQATLSHTPGEGPAPSEKPPAAASAAPKPPEMAAAAPTETPESVAKSAHTGRRLPKTGTEWPLVGLIGLMSLVGAVSLRQLRVRL
jgi:LPXTG-motif cell wall-anchored protein